MLPSTPVFLARAVYVPEKRQIVAEFSNRKEKYSKRYAFFPKMFFPLRGVSPEALKEVLSQCDLRRLRFDIEGGTATIFAATFSDLKKVNNLLGECLGFLCNLVEPERQFLIERGWDYFAPFAFDSGEPRRLDGTDFPEISLAYFAGSLSENFSQLAGSNRALAEELVLKIAMSRLLKVPLVEAESGILAEELFLENVFFESSVPVSFDGKSRPRGTIAGGGMAEVDFSRLVSIAASRPLGNIGPESLNCRCCAPPSLSEKNALYSSLVRVKFLKEGLYFNSASRAWSEAFHSSHSEKDAREQRKREYYYDFHPAGPFTRGSEAEILFADALRLEAEGSAAIIGAAKPVWFCLNSESALSRGINSLKAIFLRASSSIEEQRVSLTASHGLFFSQSLQSSPAFYYSAALAETASKVLSSLPPILADPNGRFFDAPLAISFECLRHSIGAELESLAHSAGERPRLPEHGLRMLVDKASLLSLSSSFSGAYRVGKPFIGFKGAF